MVEYLESIEVERGKGKKNQGDKNQLEQKFKRIKETCRGGTVAYVVWSFGGFLLCFKYKADTRTIVGAENTACERCSLPAGVQEVWNVCSSTRTGAQRRHPGWSGVLVAVVPVVWGDASPCGVFVEGAGAQPRAGLYERL